MRAPSGRKILAIEIYWWHNDARIASLHIRKELMDIKGTPMVMQTCTSYSFFRFSTEHRILSCDVLLHVYHLQRLLLHRFSLAPMLAVLFSTLPCVLPGLQHSPEY